MPNSKEARGNLGERVNTRFLAMGGTTRMTCRILAPGIGAPSRKGFW